MRYGARWIPRVSFGPTEWRSDLEPKIERIFHFNINCTNLGRTLPFYELLGFKVILDFRDGMKSQEMAEAFGLPVADLKGVHLRIGDNDSATRIDLLEFVDPPPQ